MLLNSKQILQATGATFVVEPIDASELLSGITWDSRDVAPGDVYVALPGERVDGHEFVEAAFRSGARAAIVTDVLPEPVCGLARELGCAILEVSNATSALWDLASVWRDHLHAKVIAITGSVGKTTTKNLVRDVCSSSFKTIATEGNQNNELGVPNTILAADPDTEVLIVEMGMRGSGQIRKLCEMARPDWSIITNVGDTHMELLGSKANIMLAKREIIDALPNGTGIAFLNAVDESTQSIVEGSDLDARHIDLALFAGDDEFVPGLEDARMRIWAEGAHLDGEGRPHFTLCAQGFGAEPQAPTLFNIDPDTLRADCAMSMRGLHNVSNACAAAGVGLALGMDIEDVAGALNCSTPEPGRLEILRARDGFTVINDAYNANPDSMRAALSMLASMEVSGRRIAVLGDMGELGDEEVACHCGVGEYAAASKLDRLICIGELAKHISKGAINAGLNPDSIDDVSSIGEALSLLEGDLSEHDVVLVKASNFMNLARLVEGLMA